VIDGSVGSVFSDGYAVLALRVRIRAIAARAEDGEAASEE
jgi:hypothetical protein